jgi:hypothetical protein
MKGPGWIFQFDRDGRFLSHSLALDQMLWADCPASDCADRPLLAGISHLQRLPASITRAAIRRPGDRSGQLQSFHGCSKDRYGLSAQRWSYVSFWRKKMNGMAALRNRPMSLWALVVIQCAHGSAGLQNSKDRPVPRQPRRRA